ncbi:MAG: group II truncated hemoglobin [Gammaproteobacteria bacterium]|nr:group II truncated hemoglobin [Gammaproteobacteria bacterium]
MKAYGTDDASYQAAGALEGVTALVDAFYEQMDKLPEAAKIRAMHPQDLSESRRKLTYFLSGWLGGPRLYAEHYGGIRIPIFHKPFPIGDAERDAWLRCMELAIDEQPYATDFKTYLLTQLRVPAERIRQVNISNQLSP